MENYNRQCPYCGCHITVSDDNSERHMLRLMKRDKRDQEKDFYLEHIVCPNRKCGLPIINIDVRYDYNSYPYLNIYNKEELKRKCLVLQSQLLPSSSAKQFPDYIPDAIRQDYEEACLIRDQSPKASATLARRCLQGMIRDFWGISKGRLYDEIAALEDKVAIEEWEAIDALRQIGNIGAHMEKDVNVIIDIEPEEAGHLIYLIESLLESWYVERHKKQERLARIKQIAEEKKPATNS